MTAGISSAQIAEYHNRKRATAAAAYTPYIQLHTADPGAAGTTAVSAVTTRNLATFAAPSGASSTATTSAWSMTTTETITHISIWDASTAGNFKESWALSAGVPVVSGSTFSFTAFTLTFGPLAA
jgi:hypothetical protein